MKTKTKQNICTTCIHYCNLTDEDFSKCVNYEKGYTCEEYWNLLKEHNINLNRMCNEYHIRKNYLYQMLNGKLRMKYKYATIILDCVERRNYIPEKSMAEVESSGDENQ